MTFPTGWGRHCAIDIADAMADGALSDFPLKLTHASGVLPSEMFDADGANPALNGGGDIRFSSDSVGATRLACDVVAFVTDNDPANGVAEIWVKVPSLAAAATTTIYVWYDKTGEAQPAASDTYGSQAVWSGATAVYALYGDTDDSTANGYHATNVGAAAQSPGYEFTATDRLEIANAVAEALESAGTVLADWQHDGSATSGHFFDGRAGGNQNWDVAIGLGTAGRFSVVVDTGPAPVAETASSPGAGRRTGIGRYDGANIYASTDDLPTEQSVAQTGTASRSTSPPKIGNQVNDGDPLGSGRTLLRLEAWPSAQSATWASARHRNMSDPTTYITAGTPATPGGGTTYDQATAQGAPTLTHTTAGTATFGAALAGGAMSPGFALTDELLPAGTVYDHTTAHGAPVLAADFLATLAPFAWIAAEAADGTWTDAAGAADTWTGADPATATWTEE